MNHGPKKADRIRGEAYVGKGYGTLRRKLQEQARDRIEKSIAEGYFCEAIALCESIISDRMESRYSFICAQNSGFRTLGKFQLLKNLEPDDKLKSIYAEVESWAKSRNRALHEFVKVEANQPLRNWDERMLECKNTAISGYELVRKIYHRVAELNPMHLDRVFPHPNVPDCP